jgi:hypothetical protein
MDPTKEQYKILCKCRKSVTEEESISHTWVFECHVQNSPRPKNVTQMKSKVKSILIIFFDIKWIVHKEFILVDQIVNSDYYCDILWQLHKNVRRLHLELRQEKKWHRNNATSHTLPFLPGNFFTKNSMTVIHHPPYSPGLAPISPIADKIERLPF